METLVPVDIYVPGCSPRPEASIEGILKLRETIWRPHTVPAEFASEAARWFTGQV